MLTVCNDKWKKIVVGYQLKPLKCYAMWKVAFVFFIKLKFNGKSYCKMFLEKLLVNVLTSCWFIKSLLWCRKIIFIHAYSHVIFMLYSSFATWHLTSSTFHFTPSCRKIILFGQNYLTSGLNPIPLCSELSPYF